MVEDRVTDGKRIAQLLSSELTGLETGALAEVTVVNADTSAMPSDSATRAFDIRYRDAVIGSVLLYPEYVEVHLENDLTFPDDLPSGVSLRSSNVLQIPDGASVKAAVDVIRARLSRQE